ncbi:hypothetical protein PG996_000234 [Apiospora saccharicola]|uniref:Uncharacterized protein n=1 Tax=Apiospora saccharicola TaxID=335842 RepID=A0ABR1WH99_9PEZI
MADQPPWIPPRPATPQTLIHRLPDKPDSSSPSSSPSSSRRPAKYIVLLMGPTAVAGKIQIATTVAQTLACPLYQGDSLHESSAKAASLGAGPGTTGKSIGSSRSGGGGGGSGSGRPNEQRYRRMWLSKMTRTGLLFPEESRPANEGFSGFGGSSSASAAGSRRRRRSSSSASSSESAAASSSSAWSSASTTGATQYNTNRPPPRPPPPASFEAEPDAAARERRANPALLVLTHPELEGWHRAAIRETVGEYGVGVVFAPLYRDGSDTNTEDDDEEEEEEEGEELPVLKPLDPRTMTSFGSFDQISTAAASKSVRGPSLDEEIVLRVNVEGRVEEVIREVVEGAREIMAVP